MKNVLPIKNDSIFLFDKTVDVFLMEANYIVDETLGLLKFDVSELDLHKLERKIFKFDKVRIIKKVF